MDLYSIPCNSVLREREIDQLKPPSAMAQTCVSFFFFLFIFGGSIMAETSVKASKNAGVGEVGSKLSWNSVFDMGRYPVKRIDVEESRNRASPPRPLMIVAPTEEGEYPVIIFFHGFILCNSYYNQLLSHVASHGFIAVAPQLYPIWSMNVRLTYEINSAVNVINWLSNGLENALPTSVTANLTKLAIAGHSRGGKVAFALALGIGETPNLKYTALLAIDPVEGTTPEVLTGLNDSLSTGIPVLVVGSGLGDRMKWSMFPPCAPPKNNHVNFYDECRSPASHFVPSDYGHMDMLDDQLGPAGETTAFFCTAGKSREPMRRFVGGAMVAFAEGYLEGQLHDLCTLLIEPESSSPVSLDVAETKQMPTYCKYVCNSTNWHYLFIIPRINIPCVPCDR
ncbi:chlorophyllase-2, chloroplastic [Amborella trichopoda]|uniref:chlorophyllase-2, chloroplastic n=1 Tax=Amborella trichopoda TaxID=13333 RepID=UPI0009BCBD27|nr:chlorophyllase-2, chloroplastic [Amborella trichopoda]|eukprot:XP_020520137.1 chlorophyllase-2, chloroplastic [Amborella trichopoda]